MEVNNMEPKVFEAGGNQPSAKTPLKFYGPMILFSIATILFIGGKDHHPQHVLTIIIALISLIALTVDFKTRRFIRKLTVNPVLRILEVEYISSTGVTKTLNIAIKNAYYEYEMQRTSARVYWRLLMYNNYFKNRICLKENRSFSKEELDEINILIQGLK